MVVVFSEVGFDVVPDVFEVDEEEGEGEFLFSVEDLVLDGVGVRAEVALLIAGLEVPDETVEKSLFELGRQSLVIGLDIHLITIA